MTGDQYANLAYLALLGGAIAFWFFVENREGLGKGLRQIAVWALIFVGVIAAYGLWGDVRRTVIPQQSFSETDARIEVPRGADGHYHLTLEVNGVAVPFLVDTGASAVVLSAEDARRVGYDPDTLRYYTSANTANGTVPTAPVRLDSIGPFGDAGLQAFVNGGQMETSLLGMDYLQRFSNVQIAGDRLILAR